MSTAPNPNPAYLGYMNSWKQTPPIVDACRKEVAAGIHHLRDERQVGRCLTEVVCRTCGYKYMIDSGD